MPIYGGSNVVIDEDGFMVLPDGLPEKLVDGGEVDVDGTTVRRVFRLVKIDGEIREWGHVDFTITP